MTISENYRIDWYKDIAGHLADCLIATEYKDFETL